MFEKKQVIYLLMVYLSFFVKVSKTKNWRTEELLKREENKKKKVRTMF